MSWCPKCRYEYRPGFTVCSDCGVDLVAQQPLWELKWKMQDQTPLTDPQMVFFANDDTQLGILQGLLDNQNISFAVKDCYSAGSYLRTMMGKSIYGWALFVSAQNINSARELIDAYLQQNPEESPGVFPENLEPATVDPAEIGAPEELGEPWNFATVPAPDLQPVLELEEAEEAFTEESPVSESFDRRRRVMRVVLFALVLPTVISLLLLPMHACSAFLPNLY